MDEGVRYLNVSCIGTMRLDDEIYQPQKMQEPYEKRPPWFCSVLRIFLLLKKKCRQNLGLFGINQNDFSFNVCDIFGK